MAVKKRRDVELITGNADEKNYSTATIYAVRT